jgi:chromosome segregation ATPase
MSGKSWIDGTLEVISGMAPRPGTTSSVHGGSNRPDSPAGQAAAGVSSAPSSPRSSSAAARLTKRVPSQEALERSLPNGSSLSGHGNKSAAQTIRDLKASNSALSAKMGKMESDFMSEINKVSSSYQGDKLALEETIQKKDQQIASLRSTNGTDVTMDALREENAVQKHTISDLKNQLYQLQHEVEDAEFEKRDEVDKWGAEKQELMRELEALRQQVKITSDRSNRGEVRAPVSPDGSTSEEVMDSWRKLEEAQLRLEETQATLAKMEREKKRISKEHELEIAKWKATHIEDQVEWSKKESEFVKKVRGLENNSGELENLRSQLKEREATIERLRKDMASYANQVDRLSSDLETIRKDAAHREDFRRDETTDLRIVNDAQEAEIKYESRRADELEMQLFNEQDTVRDLREELDALNSVHQEEVNELRSKIDFLVADRNDVESRLKVVTEERDEARQLLDVSGDSSRSTQRMREIVSNSAKERAELERSFQTRLSDMELDKRSALDKLQRALSEKSRELEELKSISRSGDGSDNIEVVQKLKDRIKHLEGKTASHQRTKKQLREAQLALVALDDEKNRAMESNAAKISLLEEEKAEISRQFRTKLAVVEASAMASSDVSELKVELDRLRSELKEKNESLELLMTKSSDQSAVDEVLYKELVSAKNAEKTLTSQVDSLRREAEAMERQLKEKLEDRDTTISTLVKSSVSEEQKVKLLQSEVASLKARISRGGLSSVEATDAVVHAREARQIDELRSMIETHKENEEKLMEEIKALKKKLLEREQETSRAHGHDDNVRSFGEDSSEYQEKIQERDDAISKLVKQSMSQEEVISSLRSRIASLEAQLAKAKSDPHLESALDDLRQLRKENEIFAGQIVDQDEEMEALRSDLADRDAQVTTLSQELGTLRRQVNTRHVEKSRVDGLRAQLDELQEANEAQREELRVLRRQLREAKADVDRLDEMKLELAEARQELDEYRSKAGRSAREDGELKRQLDDAVAAKEEAKKNMEKEMESLRVEHDAAIRALEAKVGDREEEIESLRRSSEGADERVMALAEEVDSLNRELEEREAMAHDELVMADEIDKLKGEREMLIKDVEELNKELSAFQEDRNNIEEIKERLSAAENGRLSAEQGIIDAYERKLSLLKLDKDVTIDGLRKELLEEKGRNTEDVEDLVDRIKHLEMENKDLKDELEAKLELKNTRIMALEQTLGAQEQLVDNMKTEMDHLQSSMTRNTMTRRAEVEEMQQEVVEKTAEITRKDREITALKMEIEESRLANKLEISNLQERIAAMGEAPLARSAVEQHSDQRMTDVKERLEQVKWRSTQLHEDNEKLRARLVRPEDGPHHSAEMYTF